MFVVFGYFNFDIDVILVVMVYVWLLMWQGIEVQVYWLGELNFEMVYVLCELGLEVLLFLIELFVGSKVVLVDYNESVQLLFVFGEFDVICVVDYYKLGDLMIINLFYLCFELVGCMGIILLKLYCEVGLSVEFQDVKLMLSVILSDILYFCSLIIIQDDCDVVVFLVLVVGVNDVEVYVLVMFVVKSDLGNMFVEILLWMDYKVFFFGDFVQL